MSSPDPMSAANASTTDRVPATRAFHWRALVSVTVAGSFLMMVVSGIGLWVAPPGRIANWTDWTIFGLRKEEWANLHLWFGLAFATASGFHLALNWRPLLGYFKSKVSRHLGFRREWLAALIVCLVVFVGTRMEIPPFSTGLALTENIRAGWETDSARAPFPHAELLTLSELAERTGADLTNALSRLQARGIQGASPEIRMAELARLNRVSAQQLHDIMTAGRGNGRDGQGEARRGSTGGGYGRWTLEAFCQQEGIELQAAQGRLLADGIEASANMTIREIAEGNGYERPNEILQIIRQR